MFVRTKTSGSDQYLQIVRNERVDGRVRQQVVATLGRPIYHKVDATIRGQVFCSFLASVLLKELQTRIEPRGWHTQLWGANRTLRLRPPPRCWPNP